MNIEENNQMRELMLKDLNDKVLEMQNTTKQVDSKLRQLFDDFYNIATDIEEYLNHTSGVIQELENARRNAEKFSKEPIPQTVPKLKTEASEEIKETTADTQKIKINQRVSLADRVKAKLSKMKE